MIALKRTEELKMYVYLFRNKAAFGRVKDGEAINISFHYNDADSRTFVDGIPHLKQFNERMLAAQVPVSLLISQIEGFQKKEPVVIVEPSPVPKTMAKNTFIASLKLTVDTLIEDDEDKVTLNQILTKLESYGSQL